MILKITFIIFIATVDQITANYENENAGDPETEFISSNIIKERQVKFMNATLDIELRDFQNARVINSNGSIYLLNGIDLFVVNVESKSTDGDNLKKIGRLGGLENQPISDIKASPWRDYTIFVADLDDFSNVYVVKDNEATDVLDPIERLTKQGAHCKVKLFHYNRDLYCVIVNVMLNYKESSTMYFYKWRKSHFTRLEKVSTETANDLFAYTTETYAIVVTVFESRSHHTALNVYTLTDDDELKHIQMFYLNAVNIFPITLNDGFYFYSVSRSGRLSSYQWDNEKFVKLLTYNDIKNVTTFASGETLIIGQINNELLAYTNVKLSPAYEITRNFSKNFTKIVVTKSDQGIFVTFFYKSSDDGLRMRTLKAEFEEVYEPFLGDARDATGDCVTNIRDVQRHRVPIVEVVRNMLPLVYYKDQNENVESKLHIESLSVAKKVNIRRLNIVADLKANIKQINDGIGSITAKLNMLRNKAPRLKRNTVQSIDRVNVKRLTLPKELFEKILVKKNGTATYKGKLTTKKLTAKSIKFEGPQDPNVGTILPVEHKKVEGLSRINNLEVKTINGIDWNDFYSSLYLADSPQPIEGNLIISKYSRIKHLEVAAVNEYPVSTLVTLTTNQEVISNLFLSTFFSPTIDTNSINGMDFGTNVARLNENNIIETPVKILEAHISNLTLSNADDDEFVTKHIVGTRVEDLSQIYNGKVIIKGSLKLSNVKLDNSKTSMFINDERFGLNFADHFWMKSVDQTIGNVVWTSIISTPQIFTSFINNVPAENFVIVNVPPKKSVNLIFQRAIVQGNVYTDPEFDTILTRINKECVRRGSSTVISGTKTFTGLLTVNDFTGEFIDNPATANFVLNNDDENKFYLDCTKKFESVTINGNVEFGGDNLVLTHLNGFNLLEFFQNAVRINQPTRLGSLTFTNIKATNLTVNHINNHLFNEIVSGLENSVGRKGNFNNVHIVGNVNVGNLFAYTINEINNFDNYLGMVVTSSYGGQIGGVKRFLNGLSVVNLFVRHVNSVDIGYWFENALHKFKEQVISDKWTLTTASISEMNANMINGLKVKELSDLSVDTIDIRSNIRIQSLDVYRNLNGEMACDVKVMAFVLDNGLSKMNWNSIFVDGYVGWPENQPSSINEILHSTVTGIDQIITGDVIFGNTTFIDEIQSTGIINNVDIKNIFVDCLVKTSNLQIVKGPKIFKQPVSVVNLVSEKDLRAPSINGVNVVQLNHSIFRIAEGNVVSGIKTFVQPLKIDRLVIDGLLNGVPVNDIVFTNSTTFLPPISFDKPISIHKDLIIANNLNGINFNILTNNILRKAGPPQETTGVITFQNLVVLGDTKIPFINNIDINDVVLKTSDSIQEIESKTVTGDLYIDGPVIIATINGLDVVDAYISSIFLDQNMVIRRLEVMNEVIVHKGLTVKSQINGISVVPLIGWKPPTQNDLAPLWTNIGNVINEADYLIHQNYGHSFHILYVDFASNIKVKFETTTNHPISFIIDTVHSGEICGLDHRCDCPAQYDVSLGYQQIFINRRPFGDRQIKMIGSNCNATVRTNFINTCTTHIPIQTVIDWSAVSGLGSLTISEPIFGVKLYEIGNDIFLIVNHVNGTITAMKYDLQSNNWFTSDVISGNNIHMDVLQWKLFKVLIVLSRPSEIKSHDVARLWFYNTDVGRQGFEMFQEISGEYNLCSKLYMKQEDKFVLFLSKAGSQFVSVFMVHWGAQFQLFQTLALGSGIKTFTAFTVDDAHCLAVVTTNGYLYLYKYNNVEGWLQIVYGFFKDIESVMPFSNSNKIYLFVSMKNSATVLSVYSQGLH